MRKVFENLGLAVGICLIVSLILGVCLVGGLATEYVIEFWGSYFKGEPVDVPFILCVALGLFLGEFPIPAAIVTWIIASMM